jgi:hypothetical protein
MSGYGQFARIFAAVSFLFVVVAATCASAQTPVLQGNAPSALTRERVISSLPPSQQAILSSAVDKTTPVFIFIPGILGSQLSRNSGGQDVPFWGQMTFKDLVADNPAFKYTEGETVTARVMDKFYGPLGKKMEVYGTAYSELRVITGHPESILRFAYDWRQSNVLSARDFSRWLCSEDVRSVVKDRPIVFLAHSMGGLILKYWLEHSYDSEHCAADAATFSSWMPIQKIVFAGTPNYGAPKAVLTFSQGQTLYVDPVNDSPIWQALMKIDMQTLSRNLNTYGIRYPSAYQLLPIVNTTTCFTRLDWETDLEFRSLNNAKANIDIFKPESWSDLGWPAQLTGQQRGDFIAKELPSLLSQAKEFLCDVANYDVDKVFDGRVIHFTGIEQDTICKIVFKAPNYRGDPAVDPPCPGDGTVPRWISADIYHLKAGQPTDSQPHAALMGAKEFSFFLEQLHNEIYVNLAVKAAKLEGGSEAAAKLFAQLHYMPPSFPQLPQQDAAAIRKVADLVVAQLKLSPKDDILRLAANKNQNPNDRVNLMLVYANLSDVTQRQRAWALNNAAHINLSSHNFSQSFELSKRALSNADAVAASDPKLASEMKDLKSKAALTAAIASAHLGNEPVARQLQAVAIENGSKKAVNFVVPSELQLAIGLGPSSAR